MLRKATVYVVRIGASGNFAESKPCAHCAAHLRRLAVKRVVYSVADGRLIAERVSTLSSTHVCREQN